MQQSNVIFAAILIGFVLFITNKGELPIYLTLLRGGGQQTALASGGAGGSGSSGNSGGLNLGTLGNAITGQTNSTGDPLSIFNSNDGSNGIGNFLGSFF